MTGWQKRKYKVVLEADMVEKISTRSISRITLLVFEYRFYLTKSPYWLIR